jgi:hypothetical protein
MLDRRLVNFEAIQSFLNKIYDLFNDSDLSWIPVEAISLSGRTPAKIKDEVLFHLANLASSSSFHILVENCVSILSLNSKWFRHQEVSDVDFGSTVNSILTNKEDSRPLGTRVLSTNVDKGYVSCPDGWKVNNTFLFIAGIFQRGGSTLQFSSDDEVIETSNLGATDTRININLSRSYWSQQLTYIFTVLNYNKLDSNDDKSTDHKARDVTTPSLPKFNKRQFSTQTRRNKTYVVYDTLVGLPFDLIYRILTSIPEKP